MSAERVELTNRIREKRSARGWSQDELARRSGLSRAGVSAIEVGRLVPSAAAALSLAAAFGCKVEEIFSLPHAPPSPPIWSWAPRSFPCRYWAAEVAGRMLRYPVESTPLGGPSHDGVLTAEGVEAGCSGIAGDPGSTLVLACCDPAVALLAAELARRSVRLVVIPRSSRLALELLKSGLVHVAGLHLASRERPEGNAAIAAGILGPGYELIRMAEWEEGIVAAPGVRISSVRQAVSKSTRWVGREPGSGARQCLEEILGPKASQQTAGQARDHRGVADAVRNGWADAGVCLRLVGEDAGLDFLPVRREAYDLCLPSRSREDIRIRALVEILRSPAFRATLGELPGYGSRETGERIS